MDFLFGIQGACVACPSVLSGGLVIVCGLFFSKLMRLVLHDVLPCRCSGPDFVMLCSDTAAAHSIISIKQDEDKLIQVDSHKLLGVAGEAGDRVNFSEYIIANVKLYALRNSTELTTKSVAHFTRGELARALRQVLRSLLI
jgi:hypothetical protein